MNVAAIVGGGLVVVVVLACLIAVLGGPEINCECDERHAHKPERFE